MLLPVHSMASGRQTIPLDSIDAFADELIDEIIGKPVVHRLTEADFQQAAYELGVDVATIKAVIEIEAGNEHQGFHAPEMPIINFDLTMFRRAATRHGVKLTKYTRSHPTVFARPNINKYKSYQAAQHQRLSSAMTIDSVAAIEGTFWGMFQIGGFNWKKCGTSSPQEFAERMSRSEHEQLELFVNFINEGDMTRFLQAKDWAGFARRYNGPTYARRGYHTRLARAYKKYASQT
jgi:hypothetical protein